MVIVSNGNHKFILAPLAAELARRKRLSLFLTGGYPTVFAKWLLGPFAVNNNALARLIGREEKDIPICLVRAKWVSEFLVQLSAKILAITKCKVLAERVSIMAMESYGRSARHDIASSAATIYHYRAGFGHSSVDMAKLQKMITICDHSIVNPEVIDSLVRRSGQWPDTRSLHVVSPFWKAVLDDIKRADYLVVNSDFVKESFVRYGWQANRIFVQYVGIDDETALAIPVRERTTIQPSVRLLFAGQFSKRKGCEVLLDAWRLLEGRNCTLEIIAGIDPDMAEELKSLRNDPRVIVSNLLSRRELLKRMSEADIFLFPSLAEGSARVVFMALACGCYVITTPNSGSIVKDGIHGKLVSPGDAAAVQLAVDWALTNLDAVREIGRRNADFVLKNYRQINYAENVLQLYTDLISPDRVREEIT